MEDINIGGKVFDLVNGDSRKLFEVIKLIRQYIEDNFDKLTDFEKAQLIQHLEEMRHAINLKAALYGGKDSYIGKDGMDYYSKEELDRANQDYVNGMYTEDSSIKK